MTRVDYNAVVEELIKGLFDLDSPIPLCVNAPRHSQIAEFRTIGFTGTRQTGKTRWLMDFAAKHVSDTLIIFQDAVLATDFQHKWKEFHGNEQPPSTFRGPFYPAAERRGVPYTPLDSVGRFKYILIDDANRYFSKYSHMKTFKGIAEVATDDVIVILVG